MFHVEKGSPLEMLSIPVQQMARVVYYNENAWEEYGIDEFIPEETIRNYDPYLADNVKFFLNSQNIRNNEG